MLNTLEFMVGADCMRSVLSVESEYTRFLVRISALQRIVTHQIHPEMEKEEFFYDGVEKLVVCVDIGDS